MKKTIDGIQIEVPDKESFPIVSVNKAWNVKVVLYKDWAEAVDFVGRSRWRRWLFNFAGGGKLRLTRGSD